MAMKNPPHPGEIIREEVIEALGLTVSSAAEILGVRRATLSDVTNGKAGRRSVEGSASDLRFMQMKNVWIRALSTCLCFIFL